MSVPVPPPPPLTADVAVDVRAPSGPHTVGEPGTWEIEVVNNGPATAAAVNLSARRSGARADTIRAEVAQAGCQTGAAINCSLGDLGAGERRTIEVRLRPQEAERLTLSGEVTTTTTDAVAENDTDEDSIRPRLATVDVDVDTGKRRLDPGEPMSVVTEINTNGRPANDARVCVRLPDALAISKRGGARLRNGQACWRADRIAANRSPSLPPPREGARRKSAPACDPDRDGHRLRDQDSPGHRPRAGAAGAGGPQPRHGLSPRG